MDHSQAVTDYVTNFLSQLLGENIPQVQTQYDEANTVYQILLSTDHPAILIGYHGETLSALQLFLSMHLNQVLGEKVTISVNVNDYRERRQSSIETLTDATVAKVLTTKRPHTLPPMSAAERRLVHMHLADHPHVTTSSVGEGRGRSVTISLKSSEQTEQ